MDLANHAIYHIQGHQELHPQPGKVTSSKDSLPAFRVTASSQIAHTFVAFYTTSIHHIPVGGTTAMGG